MQCIYCITKLKSIPMHLTGKAALERHVFQRENYGSMPSRDNHCMNRGQSIVYYKSTPANSRSSETEPMIVAFPNRPHKEMKPQNAASRTICNFKERVNPLYKLAISQNQFSFRLRC